MKEAVFRDPTLVYESAAGARRWLRVLGGWIERSRQRRALAGLDGRLLDDIGIARSAAAGEIAKPFWR